MTSSLALAAGGCHGEGVDWLFDEHAGSTNIHPGNGKFVHGTWIAKWHGHTRTARKLISYAGLISELDDAIVTAQKTNLAVVIMASAAYRAPVKLYPDVKWAELYGEIDG